MNAYCSPSAGIEQRHRDGARIVLRLLPDNYDDAQKVMILVAAYLAVHGPMVVADLANLAAAFAELPQ